MSRDGGDEDPPNPHAFPHPMNHQRGMLLRDYFAAQAIIAVLANPRGCTAPTLASVAYQMADAMLAERVKKR